MQQWLTSTELAEYLGITETELEEKYPEVANTLKQIQIDLTSWIFPNNPRGKEECLKQAALQQWYYMQTDDYKVALSLVNGIQGFRVGNFNVDNGSSSGGYNPERALVGNWTRQVLGNCGLLSRATACGRTRC